MPIRSLPSRPSLEYERKEAKALLRRLRAGDPDALARARTHHALDPSPARIRLADAQLVIAREYGFLSWPRLVHYFAEVARHQLTPRQLHGSLASFEASVRRMVAGHAARGTLVGRALAAYVPRFYGMRVDDVFAEPITEADARLAVARMNGAPSWDVLAERVESARSPDPWEGEIMREVSAAMAARDLDALQRIVTAHPDLLTPGTHNVATGRTLIALAVRQEQRHDVAAMAPIMDWLAGLGFDRQYELNARLCGHIGMRVEEVRDLLDRGADPDWVAPNGISVLEHALLRYWNGEAVDVLATRTRPRETLWITAGLGDVDGVSLFLDRKGRPTAAARRLRPHFIVAPGFMHALPDPDDEEILMEAFVVAALNGRTAVLEYMVSRGFPVDSLIYETPVINVAVGNAWVPVVECLARCGADLDLRGRQPDQSARELARELFAEMPSDGRRRRIVELCGLDPDAVLLEYEARPVSPPRWHSEVREAIALAADDAARLGQADIRPENLLIGLLRADGRALHLLAQTVPMDLPRFRDDFQNRLRPRDEQVDSGELPMRADARQAVEAAMALATARRREAVDGVHLLSALTSVAEAPAAELLTRYEANLSALSTALEQWM